MGIFDPQGLPSSPTSQGSTTNNISSWAQPYVMNYLNQGNALLNQQPTAMQTQAWDQISNLQTPQQFAAGSDFLNKAGQGQLDTTGTALGYGSIANTFGGSAQQYGMNAGQNYANQATNGSIGAYMNPYVQQSLAPQLSLLNQQQALQDQNINSKAAGQGAFGGNRATLAQGLNAQNFDLTRQQAIGQGYDTAFKNAQQAQQFGSSLGLDAVMRGNQAGIQGAQAGLQGVQGAQQGYAGATQAGVGLGNIGAQQSQADLARIGLLNTMANQQYNLPYQRLNFMQGLMSGLPVTSSQTQGYQAGPNTASQIAGLGTTALGALGLANKSGLLDGASTGISNLWNWAKSGSNPSVTDAVSTSPDNSYQYSGSYLTPTSTGGSSAQDIVNAAAAQGYTYDPTLNAKGGQIKEKRYAKGGKVGSDLVDIQLHKLVG